MTHYLRTSNDITSDITSDTINTLRLDIKVTRLGHVIADIDYIGVTKQGCPKYSVSVYYFDTLEDVTVKIHTYTKYLGLYFNKNTNKIYIVTNQLNKPLKKLLG